MIVLSFALLLCALDLPMICDSIFPFPTDQLYCVASLPLRLYLVLHFIVKRARRRSRTKAAFNSALVVDAGAAPLARQVYRGPVRQNMTQIEKPPNRGFKPLCGAG